MSNTKLHIKCFSTALLVTLARPTSEVTVDFLDCLQQTKSRQNLRLCVTDIIIQCNLYKTFLN